MASGLRALACALFLAAGAPVQAAADASPDAQKLAQWVRASGDHQRMPFALVDKREARIHVFDAGGRHVGSSPALLGATRGDDIVPGVGQRAQLGQVRDDERTTPAGRFVAQPGRNLKGEHVVWADYDSAFAIHRVRPGSTYKMRSVRLDAGTPEQMRVSLGCVVVPVDFYLRVVQPVLGQGRSVVYVMPETRPAAAFFGAAL